MAKKFTRSLTGLITDRATAVFDKEHTLENWDEWVELWFKVADEVREDFRAEGLMLTVAEIDKIIQFNKDLFPSKATKETSVAN